MSTATKDTLLQMIRDGQAMTLGQRLRLTAMLSTPAILAQVSSIVMQYIDAAMLGHLSAEQAASVGLVSTTIWLFGGLCSAFTIGFAVQVAHRIGAGDGGGAREVIKQALLVALVFSGVLASAGAALSGLLPHWLGAGDAICADASAYFLIFSLTIPLYQFGSLAGGILRCSGNMKVPGLTAIGMAALDVVFNYLLIFPTSRVHCGGLTLTLPGAGLGVTGAALGTMIAVALTTVFMLWWLCRREASTRIVFDHSMLHFDSACLRRALQLGLPMACERVVMCGAQIVITAIVAPLGAVAIAANSFAVTAESLCYMPGYGISEAATTLVGQSIGAGRKRLTRQFAGITVVLGVAIMSLMGAVMYVCAPAMMELMTPQQSIISLGAQVLRIEAFAEPMFAAAIVCYGIFVGAGDTVIPSTMNFASIWTVRITLCLALTPTLSLQGVWIAMCAELCFRGIIFLMRLKYGKWNKLERS